MSELHLGSIEHTLHAIDTGKAQSISIDTAKNIIDLLQKQRRSGNYAEDLQQILQDFVFMHDHNDFLKKIMTSYNTGYIPLKIPVSKAFLNGLVKDYTKYVSTLSPDMKNKYHIMHALEHGNMTGFAKRHDGEHDFFPYREEFIFSGNDAEYIKMIKKDRKLPKEVKEFLKKCQLVYDAALFSLFNISTTMNYLRSTDPGRQKEYPEIPLQSMRSRLVFWDYQKMNPEGNLNCEAHLDSSIINSIVYQSKPGLEIKSYKEGEDYKPVTIKSGEMIVFGGREAREKTGFLLPAAHKVTSDADRRISIGFDLNPKEEYEKLVAGMASKVYKKF